MAMVASLVMATSAFAAGDKIAFVDTQTVFDKTKIGKKYQGTLKEYYDSRFGGVVDREDVTATMAGCTLTYRF